jgi:hypothetical protein
MHPQGQLLVYYQEWYKCMRLNGYLRKNCSVIRYTITCLRYPTKPEGTNAGRTANRHRPPLSQFFALSH